MNCENCECSLFDIIYPIQIDKNDFRIWSPKYTLNTTGVKIPVAKCISCGYIHIPSISMPGKNSLDPDYISGKIIHEEVSKINKRIKECQNKKTK